MGDVCRLDAICQFRTVSATCGELIQWITMFSMMNERIARGLVARTCSPCRPCGTIEDSKPVLDSDSQSEMADLKNQEDKSVPANDSASERSAEETDPVVIDSSPSKDSFELHI